MSQGSSTPTRNERPPSGPAGTRIAPLRSPAVRWLVCAGALVSLAALVFWTWGPPALFPSAFLQAIDLALASFFALELFTRRGWRQSHTTYLQWHWFDFIALVPITIMGPLAFPALVWLVLGCRVVRVLDRTLGDGFVQRNAIILAGAVEEEISDRVLEKMLARWERELDHANFGKAMALSLERNREAVLQRLFAQQLNDGAFAKIAHVTGLKSGLEKEERRMFAALIETVGSPEIDEAIRDVLASSVRRARGQLGARDWRRRIRAAAQPNSNLHLTDAGGKIPLPGARRLPRPPGPPARIVHA